MDSRMMYRLGLDVGPTYIGWAVVGLDDRGRPQRIEDAGVRAYRDGRDPKTRRPLRALRTDYRGRRRTLQRQRMRRDGLVRALTEAGLFPEDADERAALERLDPLELRVRALRGELHPHEVGRAIFHLNRRRGFSSNRRSDADEAETGVIARSVRRVLEGMGLIGEEVSREDYMAMSREERRLLRQNEARALKDAFAALAEQPGLTYGTWLHGRREAGKSTRARRDAAGGLYDFYPHRDLLLDEFRKIWSAQAVHHGGLMTAQARGRIEGIIFHQRPLKPQRRGRCTYMPQQVRAWRAMPSVQRYRILREANALEWMMPDGQWMRAIDNPEIRDAITGLLHVPVAGGDPSGKKTMVTFGRMRRHLSAMGLVRGRSVFNFEDGVRKHVAGDQTGGIMRHEDYVGPDWDSWPLARQDEFISIILDPVHDDSEVARRLVDDFGLSDFAADNCTRAPLVTGTLDVSLQAAKVLGDAMRSRRHGDAVADCAGAVDGFVMPQAPAGGLLERLPYYGEALAGHIIPGSGEEADCQARIGMVPNVTVHIVLNQLRLVVNEILGRYGAPHSIGISIDGEVPMGTEALGRARARRAKRGRETERIDRMLDSAGQAAGGLSRRRVRLWEQQGGQCAFSGVDIGLDDLFGEDVCVHYLLSLRQTLDDSMSNLVVCTRRAADDKGMMTPFEAFGHSPDGYDWQAIMKTVGERMAEKSWRFGADALERWMDGHEDLAARHLAGGRYADRLFLEYLGRVCERDRIDAVPGYLVGLLRRWWGIDRRFAGMDGGDDLRNHGVNGVIAAMTSGEVLKAAALDGCESGVEPWPGFAARIAGCIRNIAVSHKSGRKKPAAGDTDGQLHNATAYGLAAGVEADGRARVVLRCPVWEFTDADRIATIRDRHLRKVFLQAFRAEGAEGVMALAQRRGIRSLRRTRRAKVIPITAPDGRVRRHVRCSSNWGFEIYEWPAGHEKAGRWVGVAVTRHEANRPSFQPGCTLRPHPAARRVMRLHVGDCVEISLDGRWRTFKVQSVGAAGVHLIAVGMAASRRGMILKSAVALQDGDARKVSVSAAGRKSIHFAMPGGSD